MNRVFFTAVAAFIAVLTLICAPTAAAKPKLLTDPFLQLPTADGVHVVWFTDWRGRQHTLTVDGVRHIEATTTKLSRVAEDAASRVGAQTEDGTHYTRPTPRDVWRHEAYVDNLTAGWKAPYFVTSIADDGSKVQSGTYTLSPLPSKDQASTILLTSDHQLKPMTPANLEMVEQEVGRVDAVFMAGDLVNTPDRASHWFDDNGGAAFFTGLQGRASQRLDAELVGEAASQRTYTGARLIQDAPLFPVIGNHEIMGRYDPARTLDEQQAAPYPYAAAAQRYDGVAAIINANADEAARARWIEDQSFNTVTYEEIFTLPDTGPGGERYYSVRFGNVFMIGLFATRIWRTPSTTPDARGKYRERAEDVDEPDRWGWGDFVFEDLSKGSPQYEWLAGVLESKECKEAKYRVVIMHQGPHGLGENNIPVFAHPVPVVARGVDGRVTDIRYEYPLDNDMLIRDVQPLLEKHDVELVLSGHSHLWSRFAKNGVNYLESSNVGNSYGCYLKGYRERDTIPNDPMYDAQNYPAYGDPHGLDPIPPSVLAPLETAAGPLPCVDSNELTVFSVLFTATGTVRSYVHDTSQPDSQPVLFDEFDLAGD